MKLFSIIVPCYNSREMLGDLLQSIINQHMDNDIEVILADDCSTEPYDDIVDKFNNRLMIIRTKTAYNKCPANTRQAGVEKASGEWLVFADHDDIFLPNTLPVVRKYIKEHPTAIYIQTPFYEIEPFENKISRTLQPHSGWTHGKFIKRKELWERGGLSYKKDLLSHEDIYITNSITCCMEQLEQKPHILNTVVYCWRAWPKSQSKSTYYGSDGKPHDFLQCFFGDYIEATGRVYLDAYKANKISAVTAKSAIYNVIGYSYFYNMGFQFREPQTYLKENNKIIKCFIEECIETLDITLDEMINYFLADGRWQELKEASSIATGDIIEPDSLFAWIKSLGRIKKWNTLH